jgi:23S rRNA (cytosine1962-C5)-methyltransferase
MSEYEPTGRVLLRPKREQRLIQGHLWVYEGDIAATKGTPDSGDLVDVYSDARRFCGRGLYNPHSKIRTRLLTVQEETIDGHFWERRIRTAVHLRRKVVAGTNAYRVIHGEGDLLPGLIVDRYADVLVMQSLSYGMDRRREVLADLLMAETGGTAVYLRNDAKSRALEGLPQEKGFLRGQSPIKQDIYEGGARFAVDIEHGQKTGWFCDQRENRLAVATLSKDADVLEAFCHTGAFGIHAALHGARSVLGTDVSLDALTLARHHADLNGVNAVCRHVETDVFTHLRELDRNGGRFDVVILDPPAFARSRHAVPHAVAGYKEINLWALRLVRPAGFLVTCSCSHHVGEHEFWSTVASAARDAKRQIRLLESRSQGRDHPMLAAMPETRYLKCLIIQVL